MKNTKTITNQEANMRKIKIKIKGTKQITVPFKNQSEVKKILNFMLSKLPKDRTVEAKSKIGKVSRLDYMSYTVWNLGRERFLPTQSITSTLFPNVVFKAYKKVKTVTLLSSDFDNIDKQNKNTVNA